MGGLGIALCGPLVAHPGERLGHARPQTRQEHNRPGDACQVNTLQERHEPGRRDGRATSRGGRTCPRPITGPQREERLCPSRADTAAVITIPAGQAIVTGTQSRHGRQAKPYL
jgi:hypothetical protein